MKKTIKILLAVIFIFLLIWFLPIPDFIAFKIGLDNSVMGSGVGIAAIKPIQYRQYELLKKFSSTEKLIKLYENHQSEAVKCYSFWALTERLDSKKLFELLKSGLSDDREVSTMFGCFIGSSTVADFLIRESRGLISNYDSLVLDSLILFSDKKLISKHILFMKIEPKETYYDRIRTLTLNQESETAIIALAKFQKKQDIDLIFNQLKDTVVDSYYSFLAIKYMPNDTFANLLLQKQEELINKSRHSFVSIRALYKALVRIDNVQIKKRLETFIEQAIEIQEAKFLPDSIKYKNKYNSGNLIKTVSSYNKVRDSIENIEFKYGEHLRQLRLALFDFPQSRYQYLAERMRYDSSSLESIKVELSYTNDIE